MQLALRTLAPALAVLLPQPAPVGALPPHDGEGVWPATIVRDQGPAGEPARIAGDGPTAVLRFEITDEAGAPIPGRLTFVTGKGDAPDLFPNEKARPLDLAVRKNVVYSLSGRGAITVPAGRYTVYATRGIEWSRASQELDLQPAGEARFTAALVRELDTTGWISGDFHLHTVTFSGHGDADLEERIISIVGEGVEFAVATDHDHNTDYAPTIAELGAGAELTAVTGNEVSVPIGHFNAFPLDPDRPVPDPEATDANALFKLIRAEPNRFGITPIIQLNHPRWREIDYFTLAGLDPMTGESRSPNYSADFDTVEVLNANAGWGYYDADVEHEFSTGPSVHWALQDWFNLLNRGQRAFAVGNSDSHTVLHDFAGYPRNFVRSPTDDPGAIDPAEVARALRAGRTFTSTGPFVDLRVNGGESGSLITASGGRVQIQASFQSASWIQLARARVIVNGHEVSTKKLERSAGEDGVLRWNSLDAPLSTKHDCWIALLVEGDEPLDPIIVGAPRPVLPLAVTNPVWVDADGDGKWTSPWERALALVREHEELRLLRLKAVRGLSATEEALFVLAAAHEHRPYATYMAREALGKFPRILRLAGARAAEAVAEPSLLPDLERTLGFASDPYLGIAMLRAMKACDAPPVGAAALQLLERFGAESVGRYAHEIDALLPGSPVTAWRVIGYFAEDAGADLLDVPYPPEADPDTAHAHVGREGGEVRWIEAVVDERGFVDLRAIDPRPERCEHAVAYAQTWLYAPEAMSVAYSLGTDDGCKLFAGDALAHEDRSKHRAEPLQHVGRLELGAGWTRVLVKVANGTGGFGLYFRVLDDRVRAAPAPD